jgi:hypothetical protein
MFAPLRRVKAVATEAALNSPMRLQVMRPDAPTKGAFLAYRDGYAAFDIDPVNALAWAILDLESAGQIVAIPYSVIREDCIADPSAPKDDIPDDILWNVPRFFPAINCGIYDPLADGIEYPTNPVNRSRLVQKMREKHERLLNGSKAAPTTMNAFLELRRYFYDLHK